MRALRNDRWRYSKAFLLNTSGERERGREGERERRRKCFFLIVLFLAFLTALPAQAHETRPGYLELRETAPGRYEVLFKVPRKGGARLKMYATLPEICTPVVPTATYATPSARYARATSNAEGAAGTAKDGAFGRSR